MTTDEIKIETRVVKARPRQLTATWSIDYDNACNYGFTPRWNGKMWEYGGTQYRSLRELKSAWSYKVQVKNMKKSVTQLADEIRKEIDEEILLKLRELVVYTEQKL